MLRISCCGLGARLRCVSLCVCVSSAVSSCSFFSLACFSNQQMGAVLTLYELPNVPATALALSRFLQRCWAPRFFFSCLVAHVPAHSRRVLSFVNRDTGVCRSVFFFSLFFASLPRARRGEGKDHHRPPRPSLLPHRHFGGHTRTRTRTRTP